jgi:hypothetical protein
VQPTIHKSASKVVVSKRRFAVIKWKKQDVTYAGFVLELRGNQYNTFFPARSQIGTVEKLANS